MRVRPVASTGTTRYAKRDMLLGGHYVPAGTLLLVPFDAVHHFEANWPQHPDDFIPVRETLPMSSF
jgi:cytochrome P450